MKKSRVAIIYRSPLGAVAGYGKAGQRLLLERPGALASAYWREYEGSVKSYKNAGWLDILLRR